MLNQATRLLPRPPLRVRRALHNDNGLASRVNNGENTAYFHYDANQARYSVITPREGSAYFAWDGLNLVMEKDDTLVTRKSYTHGSVATEGIGSAVVANDSVYGHQYPTYDHRGTVKELTDDDEDVMNEYEHSAYGRELSATEAEENRFTYQSNWYVGKSGDATEAYLVSPTRLYDPNDGRFIGRDPLKELEKLGLYVYLRANPTWDVDPRGLNGTGEIIDTSATNVPIPMPLRKPRDDEKKADDSPAPKSPEPTAEAEDTGGKQGEVGEPVDTSLPDFPPGMRLRWALEEFKKKGRYLKGDTQEDAIGAELATIRGLAELGGANWGYLPLIPSEQVYSPFLMGLPLELSAGLGHPSWEYPNTELAAVGFGNAGPIVGGHFPHRSGAGVDYGYITGLELPVSHSAKDMTLWGQAYVSLTSQGEKWSHVSASATGGVGADPTGVLQANVGVGKGHVGLGLTYRRAVVEREGEPTRSLSLATFVRF